MSGLGEQIAVLDGVPMDPRDGRTGQLRARIDQYGRYTSIPNVLVRRNVIAPSEGANYGGGSSYAPGLPLLPSTIGLADMPSVLPPRRGVIDPSQGANYGGGSSWAHGMPLLPSNAGLANSLIEGGYGRAGLGASLIDGGYGRAGLGATATYADEDLAAAAEIVAFARRMDPNDGRTGQRRAQVDEYGRQVMPGVLARSNVLDPSEGANYGGGSSFAPGLPLMPSSGGLAGCAGCLSAAELVKGIRKTPISAMTRAQMLARYRAFKIKATQALKISKNKTMSVGVRNLAARQANNYMLEMCRLRMPLGMKMIDSCKQRFALARMAKEPPSVWR